MTQDYGIKVSRLGYDVTTSTDKRELSMSSEFNYFKIHATGNIDITGDSVDIAHGLSYIPAFAVWYGYPPQTSVIYPVPNNFDVNSSYVIAWADADYLHIEMFAKDTDPYLVYYIFKEELFSA